MNQTAQLYYVTRNGERLGPMSLDVARQMYMSGATNPNDMYWTEGMTGWAHLSGLFGAAGSTRIPGAQEFPGRISHAAISWVPALVLYYIGGFFGILLNLAEISGDAESGEILLILCLPLLILAIVFMCMLHHKCWSAIPPAFRYTTPGKAVGFMFIPAFNFYWAFITWPKLVDGVVKWKASYGQGADSSLSGLSITYAVLFVFQFSMALFIPANPLLIVTGLVDMVIFTLLYKSIVGEINGMLRA